MVMAEGTAVLRRNRPGTKAQDFYNWPDESFDEMDSTLAVQQVITIVFCNSSNLSILPPLEYFLLIDVCMCPAIDYTRHTLDGAACLLNSNKYFPSRVSIKESSVAKLGSVCRRIYRIFSHAYFHHRQIFDEYENETFLCHRFTKFVMKYNLMSKDNLIVPILEEEVQNSVSGESEA
uniref:MOB-like protein phocein n=1 Tax=Panthera onca TaxID=9690 RepID=UPI002955756F|nr:MOB-like protein phocein [Panthera onca]